MKIVKKYTEVGKIDQYNHISCFALLFFIHFNFSNVHIMTISFCSRFNIHKSKILNDTAVLCKEQKRMYICMKV